MQATESSILRNEDLSLGEASAWMVKPLWVAGAAFLGLAVLMGWLQADHFRRFQFAYLVSFAFFLSISLGGLFFVILQHLSRAGWSVTVRRLGEIIAAVMPTLIVLALPVLVPVLAGSDGLYPWVSPQFVAEHETMHQKAEYYLNPSLFGLRAVIYFAVWALFARYFLHRSLEQDMSGDVSLSLRMERVSAVAMMLFAFTITFASFDWLMSLDPLWFSTIYGVVYFGGAAVGFLSVLILTSVGLQGCGWLTRSITTEHYHDMGKLLFAFVVFWAYVAFSQYMLIWYANLPEETHWYHLRQSGPWVAVGIILVLGHLLIPFFGLISREVKRRKGLLAFWAGWMLVMHWIDLYWLIMPHYNAERPVFGLMEIGCFVGLACIYKAAVIRVAARRPLVPLRDPRLVESLQFENA